MKLEKKRDKDVRAIFLVVTMGHIPIALLLGWVVTTGTTSLLVRAFP